MIRYVNVVLKKEIIVEFFVIDSIEQQGKDFCMKF